MPRDSVEHPNRIGVHRAGDLDDDEDDLSALGEGVGVVPCVPSHVADARGVVEGGLVRRAALLVLLVRCLQPRVRWRALSAVPPKAMREPSLVETAPPFFVEPCPSFVCEYECVCVNVNF